MAENDQKTIEILVNMVDKMSGPIKDISQSLKDLEVAVRGDEAILDKMGQSFTKIGNSASVALSKVQGFAEGLSAGIPQVNTFAESLDNVLTKIREVGRSKVTAPKIAVDSGVEQPVNTKPSNTAKTIAGIPESVEKANSAIKSLTESLANLGRAEAAFISINNQLQESFKALSTPMKELQTVGAVTAASLDAAHRMLSALGKTAGTALGTMGVEEQRESLRGLREESERTKSSFTQNTLDMATAAAQVGAALKNTDASERGWLKMMGSGDKFHQKTITTVKELNESATIVSNSLEKISLSLLGVGRDSSTELGKMLASFHDLEVNLSRFNSGAITMGIGLASAGAAMLIPFTQAIQIAASLEQEMSRVSAVTGATTTQIHELTAAANELGRSSPFSGQEVAAGMKELALAGYTVTQILQTMPTVTNMAAAGFMSIKDAAAITSGIMKGFGLDATQVGQAADVLTYASNQSNASVQDLGTAFHYAGSIAKTAGASIESTTAALALLHNAGFQGSLAGTTLRGVFDSLLNPTKQQADLIKGLSDRIGGMGLQLRKATGEFVPFSELLAQLEQAGITTGEALGLFGQRAGPGVAALLQQGSAAMLDMEQRLTNSTGATQRMADIMRDNLMGSVENFKSALESLGDVIGGKFLVPFKMMADAAVSVVNGVTAVAQAFPILSTAVVYAAGTFAAFSLAAGSALFAWFMFGAGASKGWNIMKQLGGMIKMITQEMLTHRMQVDTTALSYDKSAHVIKNLIGIYGQASKAELDFAQKSGLIDSSQRKVLNTFQSTIQGMQAEVNSAEAKMKAAKRAYNTADMKATMKQASSVYVELKNQDKFGKDLESELKKYREIKKLEVEVVGIEKLKEAQNKVRELNIEINRNNTAKKLNEDLLKGLESKLEGPRKELEDATARWHEATGNFSQSTLKGFEAASAEAKRLNVDIVDLTKDLREYERMKRNPENYSPEEQQRLIDINNLNQANKKNLTELNREAGHLIAKYSALNDEEIQNALATGKLSAEHKNLLELKRSTSGLKSIQATDKSAASELEKQLQDIKKSKNQIIKEYEDLDKKRAKLIGKTGPKTQEKDDKLVRDMIANRTKLDALTQSENKIKMELNATNGMVAASEKSVMASLKGDTAEVNRSIRSWSMLDDVRRKVASQDVRAFPTIETQSGFLEGKTVGNDKVIARVGRDVEKLTKLGKDAGEGYLAGWRTGIKDWISGPALVPPSSVFRAIGTNLKTGLEWAFSFAGNALTWAAIATAVYDIGKSIYEYIYPPLEEVSNKNKKLKEEMESTVSAISKAYDTLNKGPSASVEEIKKANEDLFKLAPELDFKITIDKSTGNIEKVISSIDQVDSLLKKKRELVVGYSAQVVIADIGQLPELEGKIEEAKKKIDEYRESLIRIANQEDAIAEAKKRKGATKSLKIFSVDEGERAVRRDIVDAQNLLADLEKRYAEITKSVQDFVKSQIDAGKSIEEVKKSLKDQGAGPTAISLAVKVFDELQKKLQELARDTSPIAQQANIVGGSFEKAFEKSSEAVTKFEEKILQIKNEIEALQKKMSQSAKVNIDLEVGNLKSIQQEVELLPNQIEFLMKKLADVNLGTGEIAPINLELQDPQLGATLESLKQTLADIGLENAVLGKALGETPNAAAQYWKSYKDSLEETTGSFNIMWSSAEEAMGGVREFSGTSDSLRAAAEAMSSGFETTEGRVRSFRGSAEQLRGDLDALYNGAQMFISEVGNSGKNKVWFDIAPKDDQAKIFVRNLSLDLELVVAQAEKARQAFEKMAGTDPMAGVDGNIQDMQGDLGETYAAAFKKGQDKINAEMTTSEQKASANAEFTKQIQRSVAQTSLEVNNARLTSLKDTLKSMEALEKSYLDKQKQFLADSKDLIRGAQQGMQILKTGQDLTPYQEVKRDLEDIYDLRSKLTQMLAAGADPTEIMQTAKQLQSLALGVVKQTSSADSMISVSPETRKNLEDVFALLSRVGFLGKDYSDQAGVAAKKTAKEADLVRNSIVDLEPKIRDLAKIVQEIRLSEVFMQQVDQVIAKIKELIPAQQQIGDLKIGQQGLQSQMALTQPFNEVTDLKKALVDLDTVMGQIPIRTRENSKEFNAAIANANKAYSAMRESAIQVLGEDAPVLALKFDPNTPEGRARWQSDIASFKDQVDKQFKEKQIDFLVNVVTGQVDTTAIKQMEDAVEKAKKVGLLPQEFNLGVGDADQAVATLVSRIEDYIQTISKGNIASTEASVIAEKLAASIGLVAEKAMAEAPKDQGVEAYKKIGEERAKALTQRFKDVFKGTKDAYFDAEYQRALGAINAAAQRTAAGATTPAAAPSRASFDVKKAVQEAKQEVAKEKIEAPVRAVADQQSFVEVETEKKKLSVPVEAKATVTLDGRKAEAEAQNLQRIMTFPTISIPVEKLNLGPQIQGIVNAVKQGMPGAEQAISGFIAAGFRKGLENAKPGQTYEQVRTLAQLQASKYADALKTSLPEKSKGLVDQALKGIWNFDIGSTLDKQVRDKVAKLSADIPAVKPQVSPEMNQEATSKVEGKVEDIGRKSPKIQVQLEMPDSGRVDALSSQIVRNTANASTQIEAFILDGFKNGLSKATAGMSQGQVVQVATAQAKAYGDVLKQNLPDSSKALVDSAVNAIQDMGPAYTQALNNTMKDLKIAPVDVAVGTKLKDGASEELAGKVKEAGKDTTLEITPAVKDAEKFGKQVDDVVQKYSSADQAGKEVKLTFTVDNNLADIQTQVQSFIASLQATLPAVVFQLKASMGEEETAKMVDEIKLKLQGLAESIATASTVPLNIQVSPDVVATLDSAAQSLDVIKEAMLELNFGPLEISVEMPNADSILSSITDIRSALEDLTGRNWTINTTMRNQGGPIGYNQGRPVQYFASGGSVFQRLMSSIVPGSGNRDTVPAMLTPGEFVIDKLTASRLGYDFLNSLKNLSFFNTGGLIQRTGVPFSPVKNVSKQEMDTKYKGKEDTVNLNLKLDGKDYPLKGPRDTVKNLVSALNWVNSR